MLQYLLAQIELFHDPAITFKIDALEVFKEPTTFIDQSYKPTTAVMVLFMESKVLGQLIDVIGEDRDLCFRRSSVERRSTKLSNEFSFPLFGKHRTILGKCWTYTIEMKKKSVHTFRGRRAVATKTYLHFQSDVPDERSSESVGRFCGHISIHCS